MMKQLPVKAEPQLPANLDALREEARQIMLAGVPKNTRRAYSSRWVHFVEWCKTNDQPALPTTSEALVLYLTDQAKTLKINTLRVALSAITVAHREAGQQDWAATDLPGVKVFMRGLKREVGRQPPNKKKAFMAEDLLRALPEGDSTQARRDRAVLLVGFFGGLRRSEIVALNIGDLEYAELGIILHVFGSKTDKAVEGQRVPIPDLKGAALCPVAALKDWLGTREVPLMGQDPLFTSLRSGERLPAESVADIVKSAATRAGFDADEFAGHSLRSGFVTEADKTGANDAAIMRVTRHRTHAALDEYKRESIIGESHPGFKIADAVLAKR